MADFRFGGYCGKCMIKLDHMRDGLTDDGAECNNCYWEDAERGGGGNLIKEYRPKSWTERGTIQDRDNGLIYTKKHARLKAAHKAFNKRKIRRDMWGCAEDEDEDESDDEDTE